MIRNQMWALIVGLMAGGCLSGTRGQEKAEDAGCREVSTDAGGGDAGVGDAGVKAAADAGLPNDPPPPTVLSFTATPNRVHAGGSSVLSWHGDADTFSLNGQPRTDNDVIVTPDETTEYVLVARRGDKTVTVTCTVTVVPADPSSVPTDPIPFPKGEVFTFETDATNYVFVPNSYDETHQTPMMLFIWLHGCGGSSRSEVTGISPGDDTQTWISLTVGGRDGGCWDMDVDPQRILNSIAVLKTHFNIDPKATILGGYSSGGDLAYRLAFYHSEAFAGILVENTSPFQDTGSTQAASLAAARWKFNVVHLAHLQDEAYPIARVRSETDAMLAAGFPLTRIERVGGHINGPGDIVEGEAVGGTWPDFVTYLFPYLHAGWSVPFIP